MSTQHESRRTNWASVVKTYYTAMVLEQINDSQRCDTYKQFKTMLNPKDTCAIS